MKRISSLKTDKSPQREWPSSAQPIMANNSQKKITVNKFTLEVRKEKNLGSIACTRGCYLAAVAQWKHISSRNLQCFSVENTGAGSACADSHLPSACICIHFNAHVEGEHVFNGNHGKMNYTDSVRDLMIYVHNTLKQMRETGHSRWRWQEKTESGLFLGCERQQEMLESVQSHTHTHTLTQTQKCLSLAALTNPQGPGKARLCLLPRLLHPTSIFELIRAVCSCHHPPAWCAVVNA